MIAKSGFSPSVNSIKTVDKLVLLAPVANSLFPHNAKFSPQIIYNLVDIAMVFEFRQFSDATVT